MDEITTYFVRTPVTEIGALLLVGHLHLRLLVGRDGEMDLHRHI
jgi:hypothetical protein